MPPRSGLVQTRQNGQWFIDRDVGSRDVYRPLSSPDLFRSGWVGRDKSGVVRHYAPIVEAAQRAERTISARFLSEDERVAIADMLAAGQSLRRIAASLGRAPSTVGREVRRNGDGAGKYRPAE